MPPPHKGGGPTLQVPPPQQPSTFGVPVKSRWQVLGEYGWQDYGDKEQDKLDELYRSGHDHIVLRIGKKGNYDILKVWKRKEKQENK